MDLRMSQHVSFKCESLVAVITLIRSLRLVSGDVLLQVTPIFESSITNLTLVRFVLTVGLQVASQCRGVHKGLLTEITFVWSLSSV